MFQPFIRLLLLTQLAVSGTQVQPRDPVANRPAATGSISGRVTAADTGAPIRRAQVMVGGGSIKQVVAFTDAEGRFVLSNLSPGSYLLTATAGFFRGGYLPGGYGVAYLGPAVGGRPTTARRTGDRGYSSDRDAGR